MGYETTKFGYAGDGVAIVTTVNNHYGQKFAEGSVGHVNTSGAMNELVIDLDSDMLAAGTLPLQNPIIPNGARVTQVMMEVNEAFVMTGTPVIDIGTAGSEATNGFTITEGQLEALQTYDLTSALSSGWATGFVADTEVSLVISSGAATSADKLGKARVIITYVNM